VLTRDNTTCLSPNRVPCAPGVEAQIHPGPGGGTAPGRAGTGGCASASRRPAPAVAPTG
jgi:hypothetical protein